jgi:hypothetical protein
VPVLVNDMYQAMNDTAKPILFKFTIENENFKIPYKDPINPVESSNSILFHETIPLIQFVLGKKTKFWQKCDEKERSNQIN